MKKRVLFLLLVFFVGFSCSENEEMSFSPQPDNTPQAAGLRVSAEEALRVADSYMKLLTTPENQGKTRSAPSLEVYGKENVSTRSATGASLDTMMYIVNYGNSGFVLVAGDRYSDTEVFGLSEDGSFRLSDTVNNPQIRLVLDLVEYNIRNTTPLSTRAEYITGRDNRQWRIDQRVEKLVHSQWDQGAPFNQYCFTTSGQQAVAGCVPIAISQVMYYHQHPKRYQSYAFDWNGISRVTDKTAAQQNPVYASQAARLIREAGSLVHANYGVNATGASTVDYAVSCFEAMSYNVPTVAGIKGMYTYTASRVKDGLSNYGPVLIRGSDNYGAGGHAWVLDGYMQMQDITTGTGNQGTKEFVRCKWGWSYGMCDGYYYSGIFDLSQGAYFNGDGYASGYNFGGGLMVLPYLTVVPQPIDNRITMAVERNGRSTYLLARSEYPVTSNIDIWFTVTIVLENLEPVIPGLRALEPAGNLEIISGYLSIEAGNRESLYWGLSKSTLGLHKVTSVDITPSQDAKYKYIRGN